MSVSPNILDLIDGAIRDHTVSMDAMRWQGRPAGLDVVAYIEGTLGRRLEPWQRRLVVTVAGAEFDCRRLTSRP